MFFIGDLVEEGRMEEGMEGWKRGWMDGRMEEGKCLNHRLHGLHGEEKLLSARFSFNAGTSNQGIKESTV